jgi:hypothetical protein
MVHSIAEKTGITDSTGMKMLFLKLEATIVNKVASYIKTCNPTQDETVLDRTGSRFGCIVIERPRNWK